MIPGPGELPPHPPNLTYQPDWRTAFRQSFFTSVVLNRSGNRRLRNLDLLFFSPVAIYPLSFVSFVPFVVSGFSEHRTGGV